MSSFRTFAIPTRLTFSRPGKLFSQSDARSQSIDQPDTLHFGLVKELSVRLDLGRFFTDCALELLPSEVYVDGSFPQACSIKLDLVAPVKRQNLLSGLPKDPRVIISALVQRILQMTPAIRTVSVVSWFSTICLSPITAQGVADLFFWLYQIAARMAYAVARKRTLCEPQLDDIRNTVDLSYNIRHCNEHFVQLVRQSAPTLQSLDMTTMAQDVRDIVQDNNGRYLQYPRLHTLKLTSHGCVDTPQASAFEGAVPFPSLRHLHAGSVYPFSDDTIFRGNANTLESLEIALDDRMVVALQRLCVFAASSHPKLRHVKTSLVYGPVPSLFATPADYARFAHSIGPAASMRTIDGVSQCCVTLRDVTHTISNHASIQIPCLPSTSMCLWDVVALVKSLPQLAVLRTHEPRLRDMPADTTMTTLPAYVISNYAPMCERFRYWSIEFLFERGVIGVIQSVLLLALICPNFNYTTISCNTRVDVMVALESVLSADKYKPYAPRLKRFF